VDEYNEEQAWQAWQGSPGYLDALCDWALSGPGRAAFEQTDACETAWSKFLRGVG
jgi:hypothetical protein